MNRRLIDEKQSTNGKAPGNNNVPMKTMKIGIARFEKNIKNCTRIEGQQELT